MLMASTNNTQTFFSSSTHCIQHEFIQQVNKQPQKIAIELDEQSLTYNELLYYAQCLSLEFLTNSNYIPGNVFVGMLSIIMAGGSYCSLSPQDHKHRLQSFIEQTQTKGEHNVVISKDASEDLIYPGARPYHYDCLLKRNVYLSNLVNKNSNHYIRKIIDQLISNVHLYLRVNQCQGDELTIVYGSILIQQIFEQSFFTAQWTRTFPQFVLNIIKTNKDQNLMKDLIEMAFPIHSSLVTKLLNELLQRISSKNTIKLNEYQFEIPQHSSQFNLQLFLSKYSEINFHFNDYPSKQKTLQHQFYLFLQDN
ncbi:unnamed protein product [Adineta steineri]|uniref:Uncharacterized protein n=1 Tax=Adineta steineri TaxID=433720 RepID=A0A815JT86_9BILA|nr:unnamed protein product [Adineta steineri]CAF3934997.1 unnamed protein product [Adineta steineri]